MNRSWIESRCKIREGDLMNLTSDQANIVGGFVLGGHRNIYFDNFYIPDYFENRKLGREGFMKMIDSQEPKIYVPLSSIHFLYHDTLGEIKFRLTKLSEE